MPTSALGCGPSGVGHVLNTSHTTAAPRPRRRSMYPAEQTSVHRRRTENECQDPTQRRRLEVASTCETRGDPALDIRHDDLLADVVKEIVVIPFVQLERLVFGAGFFVKEPATARLGGSIFRP